MSDEDIRRAERALVEDGNWDRYFSLLMKAGMITCIGESTPQPMWFARCAWMDKYGGKCEEKVQYSDCSYCEDHAIIDVDAHENPEKTMVGYWFDIGEIESYLISKNICSCCPIGIDAP